MNVGDYYGNVSIVGCVVGPIVGVGNRLDVPGT